MRKIFAKFEFADCSILEKLEFTILVCKKVQKFL